MRQHFNTPQHLVLQDSGSRLSEYAYPFRDHLASDLHQLLMRRAGKRLHGEVEWRFLCGCRIANTAQMAAMTTNIDFSLNAINSPPDDTPPVSP